MKNILSIDGGGIRSYIPLRILNEIEKRTRVPISELFDYFAGVSAGAIVVSLILKKNEDGKQKYSIQQILEIFEEETKKIFYCTYANWFSSGFGFFGSKYDSENISKMLTKYIGKAKINELIKPITIITYDLLSNSPYYITNTTANNLLVSDCVMATTAAPTYFNPHPLTINDTKYLFIDGGVVTNNPVENCFLDANEYFKKKSNNNNFNYQNENNNFYVLSLGTGCYQQDNNSYSNGLFGWASKILDIVFSGNTQDKNYELKMIEQLFSGNKINRIDVPLNKPINLDDISSFDRMNTITEKWIAENDALITEISSTLLHNYNKIITTNIANISKNIVNGIIINVLKQNLY